LGLIDDEVADSSVDKAHRIKGGLDNDNLSKNGVVELQYAVNACSYIVQCHVD